MSEQRTDAAVPVAAPGARATGTRRAGRAEHRPEPAGRADDAGRVAARPPARRLVLQAVGFHLLTRLVTIGAIVAGASRTAITVPEAFARFDGRWFRIVAVEGYPATLPVDPGGVSTNATAFFPLYPALVRAVMATGLPFWVAACLVSLLASTAAAALVALAVREYAPRAALLTACCWSVLPTASVLSVAYSEALFTMLVAAALLLTLRRTWWAAALVAALAGLTRMTGAVVAASVGITALVALVRHRDRSAWWGAVAAAGVPLALLIVSWPSRRADAWFVTQREGWNVHFDGGLSFVRWVVDGLGAPEARRTAFVILVLVMVVLTVLSLAARPPLAVVVLVVGGVVLALGQGGEFYLSPLRFLLPIFPILVPAALWLSRRSRAVVVLVLLGALTLSAGVGVYYFTLPDVASP